MYLYISIVKSGFLEIDNFKYILKDSYKSPISYINKVDFSRQIRLNRDIEPCGSGVGVRKGLSSMSNFGENRQIETAIIPKGTIINGNVEITGKLEMYGTINGDIQSTDKVNIYGSNVNGNIKANELSAKDAFIEGKIECAESATIRENTVVLGDISANGLVVDGAIQGKLDIHGLVTLGDKAIVDSDIKAKSIQVSNGAAINGYCSLCYAEVTPKNFFPETEPAKAAGSAKNTEKTRKSAAS